MTNDLSESISQRFGEEEAEETRRIQEITDELGRRCSLYETKFREGKADGDGLVEQRVTEDFAKETGMWLPISEMMWHNRLFVDTAYSNYAFTGFVPKKCPERQRRRYLCDRCRDTSIKQILICYSNVQ